MSPQLGFAALCFLGAVWIIYRSRGDERDVLPNPDPKCQRNSVEAIT